MPTFMDRNPELRQLINDVDEPSLILDLIARSTEKVLACYVTFAQSLPDTSAWKHGKVEHVTHGVEEVHTHADLFGLTTVEVAVVSFPLLAHDTGRLIHEHIQRSSGMLPPWRHGVESALFAEDALGAFGETALGQAMLLAIRHHSDVTTPGIETVGGSKAAHALVGLIRDFDKMTGFDEATRYTSDERFKRQKIETNFSTQRRKDQNWGEEKGVIVPAYQFEDFLAGKALIRRDCESYEAYMAQFLAWLYDMQNPEVLVLCITRGGPKIVLRYLLTKLKQGSPEQYERLLNWAHGWRNGVLLAK